MDALIFAGGLGTRLRAVVSHLPKPLAPIRGRPFLDYLLQQLSSISSLNRVILALGYKAEAIRDYYKDHTYPFELVFIEEKEPLGTGGALKNALPAMQSETLLVLNGDSYLEFSFENLAKTFHAQKADIVMVGIAVADASRYGRLNREEASGRLKQFLEKNADESPGIINGGIYLMKRALLEELPQKQAFSLEKEVFPSWIEKRFFVHETKGLFIDIGTPESFLQAQTLLKDRL